MGLSEEEKATLAALQAKAEQPDETDDDFEFEYWQEGEDGRRHGGRIPYSKGKLILGKHFPDLFGDKLDGGSGAPDGGDDSAGGTGGDDGDPNPPRQKTSEKYFGRGGKR